MSEISEKFSVENISKKIKEKVEKAFGLDHNIKTALFKPVSEYNDEGYDYNPILILIDDQFDEVNHNIDVWCLCPDEDESSEYYEEESEELDVPEVTVKF